MAIYFLDSSAILKLYLTEVGARWVTDLMMPAQGHQLYVAGIAQVEVIAALARRGRGGRTPPAQVSTAIAQFRLEFGFPLLVIEVTPALLSRAAALAETHALRGYDAVQLAGALEVQSAGIVGGSAATLVSSDVELNVAASVEGLAVENPDHHP